MPQCKNNPKKSYKGTEPSPKGLGYCGSGEKEGTIKKGKDGKQWIIKNKRWIKYNSNKKNKDESYKTYYIHDNMFIPYYVNIYKNKIEVFKYNIKKHNIFNEEFSTKLNKKQKDNYIKMPYFNKIKFEKIFIGKSVDDNITFGMDIGKNYDGNTILIKIDKNNYIYIGNYDSYSFKTDDNIIKYYSSIGSNDVPYPVAIGEKYVYFLVEKTYVLKTLFKKNSKESEYINDYYEYIKKKDINNIKNVKIIQKRFI